MSVLLGGTGGRAAAFMYESHVRDHGEPQAAALRTAALVIIGEYRLKKKSKKDRICDFLFMYDSFLFTAVSKHALDLQLFRCVIWHNCFCHPLGAKHLFIIDSQYKHLFMLLYAVFRKKNTSLYFLFLHFRTFCTQ